MKQYLKILIELLLINDGNGKWLPTMTRIQIMKILTQFKREEQFLSLKYDVKDYTEFFAVWPAMANFCPSKRIEDRLITFIINVIVNQSPFDAKLKSLQLLRRIMEK